MIRAAPIWTPNFRRHHGGSMVLRWRPNKPTAGTVHSEWAGESPVRLLDPGLDACLERRAAGVGSPCFPPVSARAGRGLLEGTARSALEDWSRPTSPGKAKVVGRGWGRRRRRFLWRGLRSGAGQCACRAELVRCVLFLLALWMGLLFRFQEKFSAEWPRQWVEPIYPMLIYCTTITKGKAYLYITGCYTSINKILQWHNECTYFCKQSLSTAYFHYKIQKNIPGTKYEINTSYWKHPSRDSREY